jgi:hypothetical protein
MHADGDQSGRLEARLSSFGESRQDWPSIGDGRIQPKLRPAAGRASTASHRAPRQRRWWPGVAAVALAVLGVSLLSPTGRHQWALSLFRQPSRYTTLSFNEAWNLPTTVVRDQPIAVSFTVGNQEGHRAHYRYVLAQSDSGLRHVLNSSTETVASGKSWLIRAEIRPTCATSPCQIEVTLPGYPPTIDFWLTVEGGMTRHRSSKSRVRHS